MKNVIQTKVGGGRRIAIPSELCKQYKLEPGSPIVLEPTDSGIFVRPLEDVIREVQAFFADAAPADVLLSDELTQQRKAEAATENHD